jgi:hypothetical protein
MANSTIPILVFSIMAGMIIGSFFVSDCNTYTFNVTLNRNDSVVDGVCRGYTLPLCPAKSIALKFNHNSESMLPTFSS